MIEHSGTSSYVAAPIAPAGRLIGVIYADCHPTDRVLEEWDRDLLWAFAEGFARIYEREALLGRMRGQRRAVDVAFEYADGMMSALAAAEIELVRGSAESAARPAAADAVDAPPAAIAELLTGREVEVLTMMVRGASNRAIAERLVIRPGTVKAHVKHILRKLDAVNRAEAIARYMGYGTEIVDR
jgi:DNA-binding CsgD family transcriptional regulator